MLKRTKIRRYLLAVLCSEEVYQDQNCGVGPLWKNCDQTTVEPRDSTTQHIGDANHAPYGVSKGCVEVVIRIVDENGRLTPERFCDNSIEFQIDIVVENPDTHERQNVADLIQTRIIYRMINTPLVEDIQDPTVTYKSPLQMAKGNEVGFRTRDNSEFEGCYLIRTLTFTLDVRECISKGDCDDRKLCFNFDELTHLSKPSGDVIVEQDEETAE